MGSVIIARALLGFVRWLSNREPRRDCRRHQLAGGVSVGGDIGLGGSGLEGAELLSNRDRHGRIRPGEPIRADSRSDVQGGVAISLVRVANQPFLAPYGV